MIHAQRLVGTAVAGQVHLRILETTDLHMHLMPFDYFRNRPTPVLGLARAAGLVADLRAEVANCLLFDNGDFLQGSPMGDYMAYARGLAAGDLHPVIAAMNRLGYDAATLGNHEFSHGLDFLRNALQRADFPVVAATAALHRGDSAQPDRTLLPPWTILDRQVTDGVGAVHALRVGVIGLMPPQTAQWDHDHLQGQLVFRDMVDTARDLIPAIRRAGADIVVALAHTGIGAAEAEPGMENAAIPLARIEGLDALLMGHAHMVFPSPTYQGLPGIDAQRGTIAGKPAVMAGCFGSHVGVIDLLLIREDPAFFGGTRWRVGCGKARALPIARARGNGAFVSTARSLPAVVQAAEDAHVATRRYMARRVGRCAEPLTTHLALVAECAAISVVAAAKADFVRRALRGTVHDGLPVLGAASPFKAGGRGGPRYYTDIPAGPLALRHIADLYLFPNQIRALRVTGVDLADWLERSAALYLPVSPGLADQPLIDMAMPSYNFDVLGGLCYAIDPTAPARFDAAGHRTGAQGGRIRDLTCAGRAVRPGDEFIVATNSYRLSTWPSDSRLPQVAFESMQGWREVVGDWMAGTQQAGADSPPSGWRLCLPPDTSVIFDTSPRVRPDGRPFGGLQATDLGITGTGFRRLRLTAAD